LFDPELDDDDVIGTIAAIKENITKEFVRDNYITEEFCDFTLSYASVVSHGKDQVRKALAEGDGDKTVFDLVTFSDISWAFTAYINSSAYWAWSHADGQRKTKNAKNKEARNQRKRAATDVSATTKVKKHWAIGNRSKKMDWGLPPEGRARYLVFKQALKEVGRQAWADVWASYWEKASSTENPGKRRKKTSSVGGDDDDGDDDDDFQDVGDDVMEVDFSDDEDGGEEGGEVPIFEA